MVGTEETPKVFTYENISSKTRVKEFCRMKTVRFRSQILIVSFSKGESEIRQKCGGFFRKLDLRYRHEGQEK